MELWTFAVAAWLAAWGVLLARLAARDDRARATALSLLDDGDRHG